MAHQGRPHAPVKWGGAGRDGFPQLLHAEWTEFRTGLGDRHDGCGADGGAGRPGDGRPFGGDGSRLVADALSTRNPVTWADLVVHAAGLYSLISPPRTGFRRIRSGAAGNAVISGLSSGARRPISWPLVAAAGVVVPDVHSRRTVRTNLSA
jgi:hypothetical protein